jgi:hypothetical protein
MAAFVVESGGQAGFAKIQTEKRFQKPARAGLVFGPLFELVFFCMRWVLAAVHHDYLGL